MRVIRHRVCARAGLVGNPSDGYGGRTISFTFRNFAATVVMYPWEQLEILWSQEDKNRFASLEDLVEDVSQHGYYGGVRLVKATIKRFADYCRTQSIRLPDEPFSVRYETNIPRGVGLSGSSAIVTATLKCLLEFHGVTMPLEVQPSLVRAVENDELGIACGYQDRVVQVYGGLVCMDFSRMRSMGSYEVGRYERLDATRLPPVYVAYDVAAAKTSASVHGPLRSRMRDNANLGTIMSQIADLVPRAREAIEQGSYEQLHAITNRNFDLRCQLYDIPAHHKGMVEAARRVGASAKFAGSGGAILGVYRDAAMFEEIRDALARANPQWIVIRPEIESP